MTGRAGVEGSRGKGLERGCLERRKPKIVIILGPTAVGKTGLALDLASAFDGEIISADSMQVYRHLDIGTSKPTRQERERVPQHLIDIVNPDEEFNAALFHGLADAVIGKLQGKKNIFVAGGTGLYIRALTGGIIEGPGPDEALRKNYRDALEKEEREALYGRLRKLDPRAAERIHPHDAVRIVRALEIGRTVRRAHLGKAETPRVPAGAIRVSEGRTLPGQGGALPPDRQPCLTDD